MKPLFPILSTALLLASCTGTADQVQETEAAKDSTATATATAWVGSYADTLPCADCPGIFTRLELRPDSTYIRRDLYLERDSIPFGEIGRWSVQGDVLTLATGDVPDRWRMGANGLEMLDQEGKAVESPLNYTLRRVAGVAPSSMRLSGGYVYYADAHSFTPDGSNQAIPVAADSISMELGKLYTQKVQSPPAPMPVRIVAHLQEGPAMEGNGTEEYLYVERAEQ